MRTNLFDWTRSAIGPAGCGLFLLAMTDATAAAAPAGEARIEHPALGGELETLCAQKGKGSASACAAYLSGTVDGLLSGQSDATGGLTSFCPPGTGIAALQTRAIFLDRVRKDPARRGEEASLVLLDALEQHFPCSDDEDGEDEDTPLLQTSRSLPATPASLELRGSGARGGTRSAFGRGRTVGRDGALPVRPRRAIRD